MADGLIALIVLGTRDELLLFAATGFALGGLDDLLVDLIWLVRRGWRRVFVYSRFPRASADTLPPPRHDGTVAVFVPAWREHEVIGDMLRNALTSWAEQKAVIYVGCYPNDAETAAAVVSLGDARVRLVQCARHGPTTKADCLNAIYAAMSADEAEWGHRYKAVLLHDAEDMVHPDELTVCNTLIERFALIQLPVLPFQTAGSPWISGHYLDEFAEAHSRDMVVREAIGASLPSAGVGCAIRRMALATIAHDRGGRPFSDDSLTEDYELGLRLGDLGASAAFVRIREKGGQGLVATRAHFPDTLRAAVRQKARWTIGIALAGWDRMGWHGNWLESWMRLRDRRAPFAAMLLLAGYAALVLTALLWAMGTGLHAPGPALGALLLLNAALLLWRLIIRGLCVWRHYGWRQGLLSLPRMVISNIIAMMAARKAVFGYVQMLRDGHVRWDKTEHRSPLDGAK